VPLSHSADEEETSGIGVCSENAEKKRFDSCEEIKDDNL
jgi:hypothetical protein